jgi:cystathionine beta-lyase/cystathionine gamma-synthase
MNRSRPKRQKTDAVHAGEGARRAATPLTTPVYATSTFVFESAAALEAHQRGGTDTYIYSRYGNPTVEAVEQKLAALEGAEAALLTSSGMAATATAVFGWLSAGDELVCAAAVYGGTSRMLTDCLARFGVTVRFVPLGALETGEAIEPGKTRMVWFESPTNPTLRCLDIARVAEACRRQGVLSVIDNTFASPVNQRPLEFGIDLVMHSATKYLGGHSDVIAGALVGARSVLARLEPARKLFGGVIDPSAASALGRGMKTLVVRVEAQNASAMRLAEWLRGDPRVSRTYYPGLADHPEHAIARAQMDGFGGMITFEVAGGYEAACRCFDRLRVVQRAASLGGVETLCSLPVLTSHHGFTDAQLADAGVTRSMIRLSVGLEDVADLLDDLDQALG